MAFGSKSSTTSNLKKQLSNRKETQISRHHSATNSQSAVGTVSHISNASHQISATNSQLAVGTISSDYKTSHQHSDTNSQLAVGTVSHISTSPQHSATNSKLAVGTTLEYTDISHQHSATNSQSAVGTESSTTYVNHHTTESPHSTNNFHQSTASDEWSITDYVTVNNQIRQSGKCNARGLRIPIPTKINHVFLSKFIENFHDKEVLQFIQFGWPLNASTNPQQNKIPSNHKSAKENPSAIQKFLTKAKNRNSILGPFTNSPFTPPLAFSPLGAVDKKGTNEKRIIHDLSFPRNGTSVNSQISSEEFLGEPFTLKYPGVDNLVKLIKKKGVGCAIFKRDISSAYRQLLRVDPGDIHLLGFSWKGKIYHDLTLPQGCR